VNQRGESKMELEFTYTPNDFQEAFEIEWPKSPLRGQTPITVVALGLAILFFWRLYAEMSLRDLKQDFLPGIGANWSIREFLLITGRRVSSCAF
jgi:hypothetical protein